MDGIIRIYDGTRCTKIHDVICYTIRHLISPNDSVTYIFSHNFTKIKVGSYDSLSIEKSLAFRNVITLIKSVLNKDKNDYYYKIFLEKCSYQLAKNNNNFFFIIC